MIFLMLGIGATIGAGGRYYLTVWMTKLLGKGFPYGTLASNVIGSFLAGVLAVIILEKLMLNENYRILLLVGLTGSLTTMSALSLESVEMIGFGNYRQALTNILLNIGLSLVAAGVGVITARSAFES